MNRRNFLKTVGFGAAAMAIPGCRSSYQQPATADKLKKRLNFVFILIDDLGWTDTGCYGSSFYETPNIDKLASEGMRFTDAYAACPVCSPTRASIMTGKYPARLHLTDWIPGLQAVKGPLPSQKFLVPHFNQQLPLEEVTIAEAFKRAGYSTGFIGKWHLGKKEYYPTEQGFDINIGGYDRGQPSSYFAPYKIPTMKEGPKDEYLTDRHTSDALKFIEDNKDKPFLLYLSHYAVHTPIQSKKYLIDKYKAKAEKLPATEGADYIPVYDDFITKQLQNNPTYAGMIESVDDSVGRVMKKLEELGVAENTVVIFMSDNGGLSTVPWKAPTANVPLRAGKGWLYEGGIREPMIIKWPGVVKPGSVCSEAVTSTDFYPTMLEIAHLPLMPKQHRDGVSLVPLLKGAGSLDREVIYWHYPHYHGSGNRPSGAVRAGDYKLIEWYENDRVELYNLKDDISERNELSAEIPEKADELRKMLHDWLKSVDARMPKPNPEYEPKTGKD